MPTRLSHAVIPPTQAFRLERRCSTSKQPLNTSACAVIAFVRQGAKKWARYAVPDAAQQDKSGLRTAIHWRAFQWLSALPNTLYNVTWLCAMVASTLQPKLGLDQVQRTGYAVAPALISPFQPLDFGFITEIRHSFNSTDFKGIISRPPIDFSV